MVVLAPAGEAQGSPGSQTTQRTVFERRTCLATVSPAHPCRCCPLACTPCCVCTAGSRSKAGLPRPRAPRNCASCGSALRACLRKGVRACTVHERSRRVVSLSVHLAASRCMASRAAPQDTPQRGCTRGGATKLAPTRASRALPPTQRVALPGAHASCRDASASHARVLGPCEAHDVPGEGRCATWPSGTREVARSRRSASQRIARGQGTTERGRTLSRVVAGRRCWLSQQSRLPFG